MEYSNLDIESSYRENDLGRTLYTLVLAWQPQTIVEFGTLYGYSTVAMAMALDKLGRGKIKAYDLFENYQFKHPTRDQLTKNLAAYDVSKYVDVQEMDLNQWLKRPEPFDLLHIDVSNKGDTLKNVYDSLRQYLPRGSRIIFEGGSRERDAVKWMREYGCVPITGSVPYVIVDDRFPSLSLILAQ